MKITKELVEQDILQTEGQIEQIKASLNANLGALSVLKNLKAFLEAEEPKPNQEISDANKAVQDALEAKHDGQASELEAVPLQEIAEAVAGPGAVVEEIEEIDNG